VNDGIDEDVAALQALQGDCEKLAALIDRLPPEADWDAIEDEIGVLNDLIAFHINMIQEHEAAVTNYGQRHRRHYPNT
jgi:hypothetical protein